MKDIQYLMNAYKELLKIDNVSIRVDLQNAFILLRDSIAFQTNQQSETIQDWFEQRAINEKIAADKQAQLITSR
jgi:hypothetical protein